MAWFLLPLLFLAAAGSGWSRSAGPAPAPPARLPLPRCGAALPLDAGQAFAGPRFLVWEDKVALFEPAPPTPLPAARTPDGRTPPGPPCWRLRSTFRLPAKPPASGLDRARVKWRDGALWMQAGRRVYQRDPASGQWFLMADPDLDFRDFEVDPKGRVLLVATADPVRRAYRALLEGMGPDRRGTEVLEDYPAGEAREAFRLLPPLTAATLLTGYESVQVDEFRVLFNPLSRRLFVYRDLDGSFREAALGLPTRTPADLVPGPGAALEPPGDLCWQVLPKDRNEAWLVLPAQVVAPAAPDSPRDSSRDGPRDTPQVSPPDNPWRGLAALPLDLLEARAGAPVPLPGCRMPVFTDARGRLANLAEALETYREPAPGPRPSHR
jgi:hypothetical protein